MSLVVAGSITRTELGMSVLNLNVAGVCQVVAYDPGGVTKRRVVAKSPTVSGHAQTGSVADSRSIALTLRFFGATKAALDAQIQTYLNAFEQFSYTLSIQLDDATVQWACDDAEYRPVSPDGDGVHKYGLMAPVRRQMYAFTIPTQPYPVAGVY